MQLFTFKKFTLYKQNKHLEKLKKKKLLYYALRP
jgi:hypothetical protein